ncbi:MAG: BamA/TamA family outer membrane protein [Paludibacteraceae bacterium]|nr:BamA/TamA family outer membrane protein [Paludibacteraceae bacterium]
MPVWTIGVLLGLLMLLLVIVVSVIYIPPLRKMAFEKGLAIAREKTGYDIEVGDIYLSPFHHSPLVFYRAWRGWEDLPVEVNIDELFIGHRGQDTLIYTHCLRLHATALTTQGTDELLAVPIVVDRLHLDTTTFHSDSLIETVGIDAIVGQLALTSPGVNIKRGEYPLHGLRLHDAYVGVDLREAPVDSTAIDTTAVDTPEEEPEEPTLLAFDVPDGEMKNVRFRLTPVGLDISVASLKTNVLADVSGNIYDARRLDVGDLRLSVNEFELPLDTVYGSAKVDLNTQLITGGGLHTRSRDIGAAANLDVSDMNLETMRVDVAGDADYQGNTAQLKGYYNIEQEESDVHVHLKDFVYADYDLSGTDVHLTTNEAATVDVKANNLAMAVRVNGQGLTVIDSILPLIDIIGDTAVIGPITDLSDLTKIDTLRERIPGMKADIALAHGSPIQHLLDEMGIDIRSVDLHMRSDAEETGLSVDASVPDIETNAALRVAMRDKSTRVSLDAGSEITDGVATMSDLRTNAALVFAVERNENEFNGSGRLKLDDLSLGDMDFGDRSVTMAIARSDEHPNGLRADVQSDDIPLALVDGMLQMEDIDMKGSVRAQATIDGLPNKIDISAEVMPMKVSARYKPEDIQIGLGGTPIVMQHNKVNLNGLPVYGADSTYMSLTGGLDLDAMRLDVALAADSFAPVKLEKDGLLPVHGDLATDIAGTVSGPLDSIVADVAITILPTTDLTYPIDKKNLAQVKPYGTVEVRYATAEDDPLSLGGQVNVDNGFIRYSPKWYPIMPFHVDSGSHIAFNGPVGQTMLDVSASQQVKSDVESQGEETRRVDFRTGVRMHGMVDSIGLNTISFFLEAPDDEEVTQELAKMDEETREGLAATLLATGMYVGESNVAAQRSGYAFSSIVNSRINAAMANSKLGKVVDIDISSAQTEHAKGRTNDLNVAISKSFFKDRLRITVGSTFTDNPEVNQSSGLLNSLSAEYKLTKNGDVALRLYTQRDYNNVFEGELYKAGLSVRAAKEWRQPKITALDTIYRTYGLTADAGVAYRSNNSIGPDVTLKSTMKNLLGKGETFTIKGNGAYYWALRNRHPGDPKKTDTYKFGIHTSLVFPYLHWTGDNNPDGDTRYTLGYQYENIAGGYGIHKMSGSFTYFIEGSRYITHAFTPFSLSVVRMKAESDSLMDKAAEYPQLIKLLASNEFVPSIGYNFIYNDYRSKRAVNTMLDLGVKESGNLINAIYCAFGYKWNDKDKPLGSITFNQFVKVSAELRNKFNITDKVCIATRLFAGANIPLGNSQVAPLSEAFYAGGPNSMRAASPYAYGPGNFYSDKYNQHFFHAGDVKLEGNFELRFPIVWKLYGAAFLDAGNVWNWYSADKLFKEAGFPDYVERLQLHSELYDGILDNPELLNQIALGTGTGFRLDLDGLVIRLDIGVAIHAPYQTYRYDKEGKPDKSQPITTYFNIPSALDAIRINFGIGYPF